MDDYFIYSLDWERCTHPINAIDFLASPAELENLASILELLGLPLYKDIAEILSNAQDDYLSIDVKKSRVGFIPCSDRIAPVPTQYINTIIPALILAHLNDPVSVIHTYNEFFINKKEEITPLLDQ